MATTLINVHLESVSAALDDAAGVTQTLSTKWVGTNSDTAVQYEAVITYPIPDPSIFLAQADWDSIFADAMTALGASSGATPPSVNPVDLP
jgi:hypothetical protein